MEQEGISWKIGGEAGYGIMTTGYIFAKTCSRAGLHVFGHTEYPSLIRGGHNTYQVTAMVSEVFSHVKHVDLLVALNEETIDLHIEELALRGGIIHDEDNTVLSNEKINRDDIRLYSIPLRQLAEESGGRRIMTNSVAIGASAALVGLDFEMLSNVIGDVYHGKAKEVVEGNIKAAQRGYSYMRKQGMGKEFGPRIPKTLRKRRMLLTGNHAVGLGAIKAGCKFYSAYPMTPASSILHFMASQDRRFNLVVKHAEDEIASINMAIGAGFAGVRAMTATSGGGFSLMSEGLGLAAMTETPLVIVVSQRPGPSTGLPTRTEQGDLRFVLNASQGDFPRFVIAPGDAVDCFYRTIEAFNLSEKYQCPAILLLDKYLSESHKTTEQFEVSKIVTDRGLMIDDETLEEDKEFKRYKITATGISPRTIPSQKKGRFTATGNEHDETGYVSEDKAIRTKMMNKRYRKFQHARKEIPEPTLLGPKNAEVTMIGWGSTKGPIREAMRLLKREGIDANLLQIVYLSPFPKNSVARILETAERVVVIENNKTAQLARLIMEETGIEVKEKMLKYDGRQFFPIDICRYVKEASRIG